MPCWADQTLSSFTEQKLEQVGIDKDEKPIMEMKTRAKHVIPAGNIIPVGTDAASGKKVYKVLVNKKQAKELKKLPTYQGNSELDLAMNQNELAKDVVKVAYTDTVKDDEGNDIQVTKRVSYREWEALGKPARIGTYKAIEWQGQSDAAETLFFIDDMIDLSAGKVEIGKVESKKVTP